MNSTAIHHTSKSLGTSRIQHLIANRKTAILLVFMLSLSTSATWSSPKRSVHIENDRIAAQYRTQDVINHQVSVLNSYNLLPGIHQDTPPVKVLTSREYWQLKIDNRYPIHHLNSLFTKEIPPSIKRRLTAHRFIASAMAPFHIGRNPRGAHVDQLTGTIEVFPPTYILDMNPARLNHIVAHMLAHAWQFRHDAVQTLVVEDNKRELENQYFEGKHLTLSAKEKRAMSAMMRAHSFGIGHILDSRTNIKTDPKDFVFHFVGWALGLNEDALEREWQELYPLFKDSKINELQSRIGRHEAIILPNHLESVASEVIRRIIDQDSLTLHFSDLEKLDHLIAVVGENLPRAPSIWRLDAIWISARFVRRLTNALHKYTQDH